MERIYLENYMRRARRDGLSANILRLLEKSSRIPGYFA
jgi:hypothetical protein